MSDTARRILANTAYRLVADVGAKAASIVLFVVMARKLGDAEFGVFTFGYSLALLATAVADFGQDKILTREVARSPSALGGYFANTLALKLIVALPALGVTAVALLATGTAAETRTVVLLLGGAALADLLTTTTFAVFQAFERMGFVPVVLVTQRLATAVGGIGALALGAGVVVVSAIYLAAAAVAFVGAVALLFRAVGRPGAEVEPRRWWPLVRAAAPVGLAGFFGIALFRADTVLLAAFEPTSVVGDYGAAYRLFEATLFLSWAVGAAVYPVFARLSATSDPPLRLVYERSLKLAAALTLPLAVAAAILAEPLLGLVYGAEFEDAATALALLAPAIALFPIGYLTGYLLIGQNRAVVLTLAFAVVLAANLASNLVLIPVLSLDGAALATSASELLLALILVALAQRSTGSLRWSRVLAGPALASAAAAGAMALLRDMPLAALPAGAAVYLVALLVFERAFFPRDAEAVIDLLRRPAGPQGAG